MADKQCQCCGEAGASTTTDAQSTERKRLSPSEFDQQLPVELRSTVSRFFGVDSISTLTEWAAAIRRQVGGGSISIDDLCGTDESPHWGTVDGERHYFLCFYDAVILAALEDQPVDIRTESPDGTEIRAQATAKEVTVTPAEAVFSFGIDDDVEPPSGENPPLEAGYAAICPYVKAFPTVAAYEQWDKELSAPTVPVRFADATEFATELVAGQSSN